MQRPSAPIASGIPGLEPAIYMPAISLAGMIRQRRLCAHLRLLLRTVNVPYHSAEWYSTV